MTGAAAPESASAAAIEAGAHLAACSAFADALRPDPRLTVSEWADAHRMIEMAAESGPWRTERTPYLREIMDALSVTSPVTGVAFCKGAQIGGTEAGNNWIGYVIAHAPAPMLALMPTDSTAQSNVRVRIDPLIDSTPAIRSKVPKRGSKEGGNTLDRKDFPGGFLAIRGANAAANLRSLPIRYLFLDEVDGYAIDVEDEGDPIELAKVRTRTFGAWRKVFEVSTPKIAQTSRIWAAFLRGDQRRYYVPCPHCGEFQTIEWPRIRWTGDDGEPVLECERNGCMIEERFKSRMLAAGEWRPTAEPSEPGQRSYHLSALYSPLGWYSWRQVRDDFLKAKRSKDPARMKTWINTALGECWQEQGEAPPWEKLYARRETYERNTVPAGGLVLTAAVDVQKDRLEVEIKAWGPRLENWTIDHRVFAGDPSRLEGDRSPWPNVDDLLSETWPHELGGRIAITTLAVDSSDQTQAVYGWARGKPASRVMVVKGRADSATLIAVPKRVDVRTDGRLIPNGVALWTIGVNVAKSELYGWLRQPTPAEGETVPTGWAHWPQMPQEWFEQLTAEQLVPRVLRGFRSYVWEKTRERNEALDLHVYNRAAAEMCGVARFDARRWDALRRDLTVAEVEREHVEHEAARDVGAASTAHAKVKAKKSRGGFWG